LEPSVPQDIVLFIRECVDTLGTLEILLLLRSSGGKAWTVQQISDEMRSSPLAVECSLDVLIVRGLVTQTADGYLFRPRTGDLGSKTQRLAALYYERRTAVIAIIFSRRGDAVRSFAEAFRIKKGPSDG
jgi:hypothetical protein